MNTNHVENKTFLNKVRNFIFGTNDDNMKMTNRINKTNRMSGNSVSNSSGNGNKTFMNKTRNFIFGSKKSNSNVSGNSLDTPANTEKSG